MSENYLLFPFVLLLIAVVCSPLSGLSSNSITYLAASSVPPSYKTTPASNIITSESKNNFSEFKINDELKELIKDRIDSNKSNAAMVVGLINPNGTQFYGYGKLSDTNNATVDENTIFSIGSTTKVFTTILLADMVNEGLINLNDPIEKYLPSNVSIPEFKGHKITVEDLATHLSGLPEFPDNYCTSFDPAKTGMQDSVQLRSDVFECTKDYGFDQFYQALGNITLTREPGSKVEYSTFGIGLLGHILTLKSNMSSFDELLKHNILDVLGMNDTGFTLSDGLKSRLAVGHFNGEELPTMNWSSPIAPGGALHSTVKDMLKFLSANMGLIKTILDQPMQESHLIRHSTEQILPNNLQMLDKSNDVGLYVGLGWFITTNFGHEIVWHNGATIGGYNAYMAFNPTTERGIVILCSTDIADINITTISFKHDDKLSSFIWDLLNE